MNSLTDYDRYFRQRFPDVRHAMAAVYLWGLPRMEAGKLNCVIVKSLDDWGKQVFLERHTIRDALKELHRLNLVEYTPGKAGLHKIAAKVRRRTFDEIESLCPKSILDKFVPPELSKLAKELTERGLPWGDRHVYPRWSVQRTGRIGASGAPPAGITKIERQAAFLKSLKPREILVEHDLKSAEPTILMHELQRMDYWIPKLQSVDVYQLLAESEKIDRKAAKRMFMATAYTTSTRIQPKIRWPRTIRDLFEAVEMYRNHLWDLHPPSKEQPRYVHTLGGRIIHHDGRSKMHRGKLLAWRLQGTVSDIVMPCVNKLIEIEARGEIRFYCQFHDSVSYAARNDQVIPETEKIIEDSTGSLGIQLDIETTVDRSTYP